MRMQSENGEKKKEQRLTGSLVITDTSGKEKPWLEYYTGHIRYDLKILLKWVLLAILTGILVGLVSSLFVIVLNHVTAFRAVHRQIIFLLPAAGVVIVFLYQRFGQEDRGTNQVFSTVRSRDEVLFRSAPLIFISTALTHLGGGSAGREGAAIQLGGSIGNQLGRWLRLDEEDRHVMVMCGMSAAFAAVFGTPMAAAVFAMEVISVGIMYYAAFAPCVIASLIASGLAAGFGVHPEVFRIADVPDLTILTGAKMGVAAVGCAAAGILFCMTLHGIGAFYQRYLKNPYLRIIIAGCIIAASALVLQTDDYMGAGSHLIQQAIEHGEADWYDFLLKMLLTAVTMKAGYRGGEIVPSFCIGATFGCVIGSLLGLSPSVCAAAGLAAVFCSVTNCPITSILIAFELFGLEGASYYLIAVAISYASSGYYSLYKDQTIVYSKYKARFVNHKTR